MKVDRPSSPSPDEPARKLVKSAPFRNTGGGYIPSLMPYDAEFESPNEKNALATLCLCHDVTQIASQQEYELYSDENGKDRRHLPDFTVETFVDGLRLEVKALASLVHESSIQKYAAVARGYIQKKIPFAFLVDAQLEAQPLFSSVKLLSRYLGCEVPTDIVDRANDVLSIGPLPIPDFLHTTGLQLVDLWTLIASKQVCFDWAVPLDLGTSLVSLPNHPFKGLHLEDVLRSTRFGGLLAELAMGRRPSDKCILADAATWRSADRPADPFQAVGGFQRRDPLRDLTEEELRSRNPGMRGYNTSLPGVVKTTPTIQSR